MSQPILGIEFPWANNEKSSHEVKGHSFFFFLWAVCCFQVWRVDSALFTFHLDSGQSTCHASLFFLPKKLKFNYGSSVSPFPDKGGRICCSFLSFWVEFQESAIKAVN